MSDAWKRCSACSATTQCCSICACPALAARTCWRVYDAKRDNVPVLMLHRQRLDRDDKVACSSAGADDYVVKPFGRAAQGAGGAHQGADPPSGGWRYRASPIDCGDLRYLFGFPRIRLAKRALAVTAARTTPSSKTLMLKQGKTVSKSTLMDKVFTLDDEPSADAIDIYIHRLRKHLASSSAKIMTLARAWLPHPARRSAVRSVCRVAIAHQISP